MKAQVKTLLFVFCLTAITFAQSGKNANINEQFKQLAGEPEEIALMRLPAPETLGVSSKSALIPISAANAGNIEIPIETASNFRLMLIAPNCFDWKINLALPHESFTDLREGFFSVNLKREESEYGFDGNQFPAQIFAFDSVKAGILRVKINLPSSTEKSSQPLGYLVAASDSPYLLRSYINTLEAVVGRETGFVAALTDNSENAQVGNLHEVHVKLQAPRGSKIIETLLKDNGDGTFRGTFVPTIAGQYIAQIIARGTTPEGEDFIRTGEHIFNVAETRAIIEKNATVNLIDDVRLSLSIPITGVSLNQKLVAHAEVWARDADGSETSVGWVGGMTLVEQNKRGKYVSLILDSRWLARAGVNKENYELKNVRLQDSDSLAVLGTTGNVSLSAFDLPSGLQNYNGEITQEMRTGKRPALEMPNAVGGKLMLVHGYCSGSNPWNPAQFADSVQFLDANQNRSHDQFAQLIKNFGAQFPSFGIVAHSQGGAAALHLYTYYWSGLDNATGARLIQSVGTPYQGTALAGNLALIGSIFGAGCGSNNDLTYSGAAAWLSNIPAWARAKVYYHTTSFTDVWWRYDYCNIASDLVLSDPDDGVTEKDKDQLSGANNMGHKTGWCHTSGMRDPPQTSDASRNATMNAYAAR